MPQSRNYGVFLHQDVQMLLGERSHQQRSYESRIDSGECVHSWHALGVFFDMMAGVLRTLLVLSGGFLSGPKNPVWAASNGLIYGKHNFRLRGCIVRTQLRIQGRVFDDCFREIW